ncbi:MAG: alpha amylase [Prevotella sp.]|nr:alpha amylase [Prevotella sp.]
MQLKRVALWMMAAVGFTACSSIDCPIQTTVEVNYVLNDTLKDTLTVLTKRADRQDTIILNRGVGLTKFALPMSYGLSEDTLVFKIDNEQKATTVDTVWIKKDDIPHFESVDCATHFFHRITKVRATHVAIDTLFILNPSVTYDTSAKHIEIHFKNSH